MSICSGIGNGIGGAFGKWGAGLGSALGLGAAVDVGVRANTGYGLLETLSVPYIECPDGSFVSAIEWYGSGLKCRPKPQTTPTTPAAPSATEQALGYAAMIEALGGAVFPYVGAHAVGPVDGPPTTEVSPGHYNPQNTQLDETGNVLKGGIINEGTGDGTVSGHGRTDGLNFKNYGWGGWGGSAVQEGFSFKDIRNSVTTAEIFADVMEKGAIIGLRVSLPSLPTAPPVAPLPPRSGFTPTSPPEKEDCQEVACPCLTPADIERAVKKALGVAPFAPEKLIREMGAKMFVAPGPSLVPIIPTTLVDAIAALIAANYMRAGYGRYPVLMPQSLINDDSVGDALPAQPFENFAEWFEWLIKQQDAIQGEWPVELAIIDGAKRQPLKFENISEAFAELTGLLIQTATDADAAVAVGAHAAVAATKAQAAAVIAQKNAECLIKFFGVRTGYASVFVETVITPMDTDSPIFNLKKFLTPSRQAVVVYMDNDPFDFQPVLDRILRNSEIAKSAVALDAQAGLVGDFTKNQRKYDENQSKRAAEKELEKLENSLKAQNPDFKVKIKVDTIASTSDVLGDKFVIKRPKTTNE